MSQRLALRHFVADAVPHQLRVGDQLGVVFLGDLLAGALGDDHLNADHRDDGQGGDQEEQPPPHRERRHCLTR
jgi:hypothetical protein